MQEVASLQYDVIFKKAFCQVEIFKEFIKAVLSINLEITTIETEKSFFPQIGPIDSCFDLFAEDKKNRIIVDIQHKRLDDHYHKFLHYHCVAMLEQVARSETYRSEVTVYTVVVLTSGDRHKKDVLVVDFDPKDRNGMGVNEIKHKIIYLCPKYANIETPEPLKSWLLAIDDTLDGKVDEEKYSSAIRQVFNCIAKDKINPTERAKMKEEAAFNKLNKDLEIENKQLKDEKQNLENEKQNLENEKQNLENEKQNLENEKQNLENEKQNLLLQNILDIIELKYGKNKCNEILLIINKITDIKKLDNIKNYLKIAENIDELKNYVKD